MIVVSDTTPLITLLKVQHLDLLQVYFGEVQIPKAVYDELTCDERFAAEAELIRNCSFIHVVELTDDKSVSLLRRATGLDLGESEAIVLTDEIEAMCEERIIIRMHDNGFTVQQIAVDIGLLFEIEAGVSYETFFQEAPHNWIKY